ncbi:MAG: hypothetical protein K2V38_11250 [Gemmataceae bacterium]|nr:hypothetical protein [Gemmataceae bacterium]
MRTLAGVALVLALCGFGLADDKKEEKKADKFDPKKLVGKWEVTTAGGKSKAVVEYTADGKVKWLLVVGESTITSEGEYKLDADTLTR